MSVQMYSDVGSIFVGVPFMRLVSQLSINFASRAIFPALEPLNHGETGCELVIAELIVQKAFEAVHTLGVNHSLREAVPDLSYSDTEEVSSGTFVTAHVVPS